MGWTVSYEWMDKRTAQAEHERDAIRYSSNIKAELIAHEWKPSSFFAIIRLNFLEGHEKAGQSVTFLRTDMIDYAGGKFGYKDMTEEMGPYLDDKPSREFAAQVFKYIPSATGYAVEFRNRAGIRYTDTKQLELV